MEPRALPGEVYSRVSRVRKPERYRVHKLRSPLHITVLDVCRPPLADVDIEHRQGADGHEPQHRVPGVLGLQVHRTWATGTGPEILDAGCVSAPVLCALGPSQHGSKCCCPLKTALTP